MNKDVFHNQIALSLGYKWILQNEQINISIDDRENTDDPIVEVETFDGRVKIAYHASSSSKDIWQKIISPEQKDVIKAHNIKKEIDSIIDTTYKAYIQAITNQF